MSDKQLVETIRRICEKGNHAEVRLSKDGVLVVYEVKKTIANKKNMVSA